MSLASLDMILAAMGDPAGLLRPASGVPDSPEGRPKEHQHCNPPTPAFFPPGLQGDSPHLNSAPGGPNSCAEDDGERVSYDTKDPGSRRRRLWRLRDDLRRFQGEKRQDRKGRWQNPRASKCGHTMCGTSFEGSKGSEGLAAGVGVPRKRTVEVRFGEQGASYGGLVRCGSVWACPVCAAAIKSERATEIAKLIAWHGVDRTVMLTLTVKHGLGDDFRGMSAKLANAFRRFINGTPWKRFALQWGLVGQVRAMEATHGDEHGWHPHLHVLLLLGEPAPQGDGRHDRGDWRKHRARAWTWIAKRWRQCVIRAMGYEHAPDVLRSGKELDYDDAGDRAKSHGVDVRPLKVTKYLAKLGLEISDPGVKVARTKLAGRTPFQLALDVTKRKRSTQLRERDAALWGSYVNGTRGRKALTWSRGLKDAAGLRDVDDATLLAEEPLPGEPVASVDGEAWRELRRVRGFKVDLLEHVEQSCQGEIQRGWEPTWLVKLPRPADTPVERLRCDDVVEDYVQGRLHEKRWRESQAEGPPVAFHAAAQ